MNKHKWHDEICAWAAGQEIEQRYIGSATATYKDYIDWHKTNQPNWDIPSWEYRIKPQPRKLQYLYAQKNLSDVVYLHEKKIVNGCICIGKIKLEQDDE